MRQIDAITSPSRFAIQGAVLTHEARYVSNVHAEIVPAPLTTTHGDRVVKVPRVGRINRDDRLVAQVLARFGGGVRTVLLDRGPRLAQRLRPKNIRYMELPHHRQTVNPVAPPPTEGLDNHAAGPPSCRRIAHDLHHHLVAAAGTLGLGVTDKDWHVQCVAVRPDEPLALLTEELAHESALTPLQDLDDPAFEDRPSAPLAFLDHARQDRVARDRVERMPLWHEQVAMRRRRFRHDESEAARVAPINACHAVPTLWQGDRVPRAEQDTAALRQEFHGFPERAIFVLADPHGPGQRARFLRPIIPA